MLQPCQDNYSTTFASYEGMRRYHEKESLESRWHRCRVNELHIEPLDKASPLYGTPSAFAAGISAESVEDTVQIVVQVLGKVHGGKPRSCHAGRWFLLSRPQHGLQKPVGQSENQRIGLA